MRARLSATLAFLLVSLGTGLVRAESEPPPARPRYWVDFEAGRVDVDGDLNRLELQRKVKIKVDRYRLTSEHLVLERSPRGVLVEGSGRLAFCPCEDPPVTFGFRRAIVAPPTDLFVEQPVVYVGGVPVFWSPILWLRSPDRLGMLPARFAWRGDDGFVAGTGVHVPLGGKRGPTLETLDLYAAGYLKGGIDTEAVLQTEHTTNRVRFDHLDESLVAVDSHGSSVGETGAGVSWQVDAIRGARGREGTLELEPAARRYDRGRVALGGAFGNFVAGVGPVALATRGEAIREPGVVGPELFVGGGLALGPTRSRLVLGPRASPPPTKSSGPTTPGVPRRCRMPAEPVKPAHSSEVSWTSGSMRDRCASRSRARAEARRHRQRRRAASSRGEELAPRSLRRLRGRSGTSPIRCCT